MKCNSSGIQSCSLVSPRATASALSQEGVRVEVLIIYSRIPGRDRPDRGQSCPRR